MVRDGVPRSLTFAAPLGAVGRQDARMSHLKDAVNVRKG